MSKDLFGNIYAKVKSLKYNDLITVDSGFDCMEPWSQHTVRQDKNGRLFIDCTCWHHYLDGQQRRDHYVGIYLGIVKGPEL